MQSYRFASYRQSYTMWIIWKFHLHVRGPLISTLVAEDTKSVVEYLKLIWRHFKLPLEKKKISLIKSVLLFNDVNFSMSMEKPRIMDFVMEPVRQKANSMKWMSQHILFRSLVPNYGILMIVHVILFDMLLVPYTHVANANLYETPVLRIMKPRSFSGKLIREVQRIAPNKTIHTVQVIQSFNITCEQ